MPTRVHLAGVEDLYRIALYGPAPFDQEAIMSEDVAKALRIEIIYERDWHRPPVIWHRELVPRIDAAGAAHFDRVFAPLRRGDIVLIEYAPRRGTTVRVNRNVAALSAPHELDARVSGSLARSAAGLGRDQARAARALVRSLRPFQARCTETISNVPCGALCERATDLPSGIRQREGEGAFLLIASCVDAPRVTFRSPIPRLRRMETREVVMKRTFTIVLGAAAAAALFVGLVYTVLVLARVSEPASTTVNGPTLRRLWVTAAAAVALAGVVIGGLALARSANRLGTTSGRFGAIVALATGLIAVVNGGLNLATANGGPGTGNGVVGGAAAFVLGWIAATAGALTLARSRRDKLEASR